MCWAGGVRIFSGILYRIPLDPFADPADRERHSGRTDRYATEPVFYHWSGFGPGVDPVDRATGRPVRHECRDFHDGRFLRAGNDHSLLYPSRSSFQLINTEQLLPVK